MPRACPEPTGSWGLASGGHAGLARPSSGPLALDDLAALEQLATPDTPRFTAL